jgi:hypothetical protein
MNEQDKTNLVKYRSGDYDDFITYTEEDVLDLLESAKELVKLADDLLSQ